MKSADHGSPATAVVNAGGITGRQLRAARGLLDWTQGHLAAAAKVGLNTVKRWEQGEQLLAAQAAALVHALEAHGVRFISAAAIEGGNVIEGVALAAPDPKPSG